MQTKIVCNFANYLLNIQFHDESGNSSGNYAGALGEIESESHVGKHFLFVLHSVDLFGGKEYLYSVQQSLAILAGVSGQYGLFWDSASGMDLFWAVCRGISNRTFSLSLK